MNGLIYKAKHLNDTNLRFGYNIDYIKSAGIVHYKINEALQKSLGTSLVIINNFNIYITTKYNKL